MFCLLEVEFEVEFTLAGKPSLGKQTLVCFLPFGAFHVPLRQAGHSGFQVIPEEIKFVGTMVHPQIFRRAAYSSAPGLVHQRPSRTDTTPIRPH
jgi:hypothetical protein